jgi:HK97 family phage portal protein
MLTKAKQWLAQKASNFLMEVDEDWFQRNGYYRLAALKRGDGTVSGFPSVSDAQALRIGAFYCCTKVLAEDHSVQPCFVYQKPPGSKEIRVADELPLHRVLHDLANPELSPNSFFESVTAHAAVCGTGYATIARDRSGEVQALYPIMPGEITRHRNDRGNLYYKIWNRGKWDPVARTEIFDLPGFSWSPNDGGNKVADYARMTLGLAISQEQYAGNFFSRDHTPGVVLEHPGGGVELDDSAVEKIKAAWRKNVQSHDVAVLQEGMKANVITKSNTESQLLEQRIQQIRAVAMYFRMPAYKLGDMDRMTWGNVAEMRNEYTANVLKPWNQRWRGAIYRCLLTPQQRAEGYWGEHKIESFMQGDFLTQAKSLQSLANIGVISINEIRGLFNWNPVPGGDERFIQINMQTIIDAATGVNLADENGRAPVGGKEPQ